MKKLMIITILLAFIGFYIEDFTPAFFSACLVLAEWTLSQEKFLEPGEIDEKTLL